MMTMMMMISLALVYFVIQIMRERMLEKWPIVIYRIVDIQARERERETDTKISLAFVRNYLLILSWRTTSNSMLLFNLAVWPSA